LEAGKNKLAPVVYRRALHIIGENERVLRGVEFLRAGVMADFGQLMFESHESSRLNFENSTPALDALVAIAREQPGVLGSRLTGGGFGGATVSLVRREAVGAIDEAITSEYKARTGNVCQIYLCEIADGAR
jgi:galactokinase